MKQLLLVQNPDDLVITNLETKENTGSLGDNFSITLKRGNKDLTPFIIPEVDVKTLRVSKSEYKKGKIFEATIEIPSELDNFENYTIMVSKLGKVFHERTNWSTTDFVGKKDVEGTKMAETLGAQLARMAMGSGTVEVSETGEISVTSKKIGNKQIVGTGALPVYVNIDGSKVTVYGTNFDDKFELKGADGLTGVEVKQKQSSPEMLGASYIADLLSRTSAGRGVNDRYVDGDTIYPNDPYKFEFKDYSKIVMYTLKFAVGRDSSVTRDERVTQLVHIVGDGTGLAKALGFLEKGEGSDTKPDTKAGDEQKLQDKQDERTDKTTKTEV